MDQRTSLETILEKSLRVICMYSWLLDVYVLDFFVGNHWEKLPECWRESLDRLDPQDLGKLLTGKRIREVMPLSLLSLLKTVDALSLSRKPMSGSPKKDAQSAKNAKLENLYKRSVKLKKRHELSIMAELVNNVSLETRCSGVVDFGSGLGHLLRMLAYKYSLRAAGIERQTQLTEEACKLDQQFEYLAQKHLEVPAARLRPTHINLTLTTQKHLSQLNFPDLREFGLVGLHPCGDLGPLLLQCFAQNENIKFLCIVGCCYMKLSDVGYPMSNYTKQLSNKLSYSAKEIASHAIEAYTERLEEGDYNHLKVHAYRAALERILVNIDSKYGHAQVRSVKHTEALTFQSYSKLALDKLDIPLPQSEAVLEQAECDVSLWKRVVSVYTLRLSVAPLIETVLLCDRLMYLIEHGLSCEIRPLFDPRISPRNHIIIGRKHTPRAGNK